MKEKIIKSYVKQLTKDDIIKFAKKNDIILTNDELELIYSSIKNDCDHILANPELALKNAQKNLNSNTYNKLYELYTIYYPKLYR